MSKNKIITPATEQKKWRADLYFKLCAHMKAVKHKERLRLLLELSRYVTLLNWNADMEAGLFLRYCECANAVFEYLYKTRQIGGQNGLDIFEPDNVYDIVDKAFKEYDAD